MSRLTLKMVNCMYKDKFTYLVDLNYEWDLHRGVPRYDISRSLLIITKHFCSTVSQDHRNVLQHKHFSQKLRVGNGTFQLRLINGISCQIRTTISLIHFTSLV